jgi:hypothetical protein
MVLNLLSNYYVIVFCAVYPRTGLSWLYSGVVCFVFKVGVVEFVGPLLGGLLRRFDKDGERYFNYNVLVIYTRFMMSVV